MRGREITGLKYISRLASACACAQKDFPKNVWLLRWKRIFEFFTGLGAKKGGGREYSGVEQFKAS